MKTHWLIAATLAVAGCAADDRRPERHPAAGGAGSFDCVAVRSISGYQALDDSHVILYGITERDSWVAEIAPGCFGLASSNTIGAIDSDSNGQICGFGRDNLAYRDTGRTESCRIQSLRRHGGD